MAYIEENINDLPPAGAISGSELLELLQGGVNSQIALSNLSAYFRRRAVVALTNSAGTVTVDCGSARNFTLLMEANVTTFTPTNLDGAGSVTEMEVEIKQNGTGGFTLALPASFKALGGSDTAIALAPNAVTVLSAKTFDNGTTWRYAMQESA